ncbi:distal membrane-arm assembly complex protein 2 [Plutella xylostella]|uniref:distal membrane-arm assembly complex protein 2 n=1 Tax=Plutella xylostella TaxID=51655 RepID=UPI002032C125|nr:distal membrane-arm assembly complex protein 2 [Plutella xylostella]
MALCLKQGKVFRNLYITSRWFSNKNEEKSVYQRDEEGPQERSIYGKPYPEWRKPWLQRKGEVLPKLSVFTEKNPSPDILNAMQNLPYMTMEKVKDWWAEMKDLQEVENQKYSSERNEILGSNLAAAHFFTFRGAGIRFKGQKAWLSGPEEEMKLPEKFKDGYFVEAIDCSQFIKSGIRYEGLANIADLSFLKWLSLKNNVYIDVWCLDRVAGLAKSLEFLDISGCRLCVGGVHALARMPELKMLVVTDPGENIAVQAALSILEQEKPDLVINAIEPEPLLAK